jgi:hypothetical protein
VSIDLSGLLGTQRAIRVARADYDFARDGGGVGYRSINGEIIPEGSLILGKETLTTTAITFATTGAIAPRIQGSSLGDVDVALNHRVSEWYTGDAALITTADVPILVWINNDAVTAGAFTLWVFYLPTTG